MSLHPPRAINHEWVNGKLHPLPATRVIRTAWGIPVSVAHTRRPRILRLEASKPRGGRDMR